MTVPQHHQAVQFHVVQGRGGVHERLNPAGVHVLLFGLAPGQCRIVAHL
jgi:hypothetical protein